MTEIAAARMHLRAAVAELSARSRCLKQAVKSPGSGPRDSQRELRHVARKLTVLHAMLAFSHDRIHPVTRDYAEASVHPVGSIGWRKTHHQLLRHWIEYKVELWLGPWWLARVADGGVPSLMTIWAAVSLLPNDGTREAAVQLGGPFAAFR
jgi:hypothetical protein